MIITNDSSNGTFTFVEIVMVMINWNELEFEIVILSGAIYSIIMVKSSHLNMLDIFFLFYP